MQADINWLQDPEVFRINRLDAHSDHICYASAEEAESGQSSLYQSLDGLWKICCSQSPSLRPADFYQEGYDDSAFSDIQVPGHLQLQGYGQIQYINKLYPWDGHTELRPPHIDWEHNLVGSYVRHFTLEPALVGKTVRICFRGAEQAIYVWLNGHFVGYSEDSFTPSEFDLTPWLRSGDNRLCVEVYRYSSAAWLEDQDFFRFSGIFRSVYLFAEPKSHLEDVWFQTDLKGDHRAGSLKIRMLLKGDPEQVLCSVSDGDQILMEQQALKLQPDGKYLTTEEFHFPEVTPWCHEDPKLYTVTLTLIGRTGRITEVIPYQIGFRHFEIRDGLMLLNGERIVFHGVNRHEWNPLKGRAIDESDMDAAVEVFRRNHINAVRTSHYPNQSYWYRLCDQNGFYMIDETNLETHGSWQKDGVGDDPSWNVPASIPEWRACVLDRAESMFERDKNHPAILIWSCGNESYAGDNLAAISEYFHQNDPSRIVQYEGVFHNRAYDYISDVESRMYATPDECRAYLLSNPKKPMILCEYMHDMGNSIGGMESYIRLEEEFPQYQGGFIWDYMDQAIWHRDSSGREVLGYGGDFGDRQTDYAFSGNGIVFADGTEKPAMQEVRYWYGGPEYRKAHDQANEAASQQIQIAVVPVPSALTVTHGDGALGVRGKHFEILFSHIQGGPVSLRSGGTEWLWRAPKPAFWRAPTENDRGNQFSLKSAVWDAADVWQTGEVISVDEKPDQLTIQYKYTSPVIPTLRAYVIYTVSSKGVLDVSCRYEGEPGRPQLPLFGYRFASPEPVSEVAWLGLSGETYPDRKKGGIYGLHKEHPFLPPYLVPQEYGGHEETRQIILTGSGGAKLHILAEHPIGFSAIPYTPQQLEQAYHPSELPSFERTYVTLYGSMRGVGGIDSWGADVEPAYHVSGETNHEFSFQIIL